VLARPISSASTERSAGTPVAARVACAKAPGGRYESELRRISALVTKLQNDFLDVPGLTLTLSQAQKRFATDAITCEAVLDALVDAKVLARASNSAYVRFFPRNSARPRFAP
jgi:hypothetical protein